MVVLGRITAPYGVKGWLRLHAFGDEPARWREMPEWWLGPRANEFADWRPWALEAMRSHGAGWLVKLAGIDDRTAAERLRGHYVGAPREALPSTAADEYYWADLIGLAVFNARGEGLGRVVDLIETGAHAVLVVREGEGEELRERLLPFVAAVVSEVDRQSGVIRVAWERDW